MAVPPALPLNSLARKIIKRQGYTAEQEVLEVAKADQVSQEEAARRIAKAREQSAYRAAGQRIRQTKVEQTSEELRLRVLAIAASDGQFRCTADLERLAAWAGRAAPHPAYGRWDASRILKTICRPLHNAGMLLEVFEAGQLVGFTVTEAGRKELQVDDRELRALSISLTR